MTTIRRAARWAWPTTRRPAQRPLATVFWLRLGTYGVLATYCWVNWWYHTAP